MNEKLILLVEDDKRIQAFNKRLFEGAGFAIETAATIAQAWASIKRVRPDAIVLDVGMPDGSGLDFLRELRSCEGKYRKTPILLLTGYGKDQDVVLGFESGCDDYLPKPYTFEVLLARLKHLLHSAEQVPEILIKGPLALELISMQAYVSGKHLRLTPKEFMLPRFFIQNEDCVISAANIYARVWGQPMADDTQALGGAVSRLRKKLKGSGYTISVEYGYGYRFERGEP